MSIERPHTLNRKSNISHSWRKMCCECKSIPWVLNWVKIISKMIWRTRTEGSWVWRILFIWKQQYSWITRYPAWIILFSFRNRLPGIPLKNIECSHSHPAFMMIPLIVLHIGANDSQMIICLHVGEDESQKKHFVVSWSPSWKASLGVHNAPCLNLQVMSVSRGDRQNLRGFQFCSLIFFNYDPDKKL